MVNSDTPEIKGSAYETFIRRAYLDSDNSKPGAHKSIIINLISAENGDPPLDKRLGSSEKQLSKAKTYIQKALDKYLKMKCIPPINLEKLGYLKQKIDLARTSYDLMGIIYEGLELTESVKLLIDKLQRNQVQRMLNNIK